MVISAFLLYFSAQDQRSGKKPGTTPEPNMAIILVQTTLDTSVKP